MPENTIPSKADIERLRLAILGNPDTREIGLIEAVEHLAKRDRNNRIVIALGVIVLLGNILFAAWIFHTLHEQSRVACVGGNERVAAQQRLWDGIVLNTKPESKQEEIALGRISEYVEAVFAPRDCDNLDMQYQAPDNFPDLGLK